MNSLNSIMLIKAREISRCRLNNLRSNLAEAGITFVTTPTMYGTQIVLKNAKISQLSSYSHYAVKFDGVNPPVSMADDTQDDTDTDDVTF